MARIYVSSTYRDLREHREAVYQALRRVGHDVVAMEDYVAADQRPVERCLADVAESDIYLGILAWCYGYVPEQHNPGGRSITELEYREARRRGIPCLLFLLDENAPWPPNLVDRGDDGRRIEEFRAEVMGEHAVGFFRTVDELAVTTVGEVNALYRRSTDQEPATAAPVPAAAEVRVLMLYTTGDQRLAATLGDQLRGLRQDGVVAEVAGIRIGRDAGGGEAGEAAIERADLVLLMVSGHLVSSGYLDTAEFAALLQRHSARQPQLVPVALRPVAWNSLHPGLTRIPALPGRERSVVDASSREAALAEVVEGVRLACLDLAAARATVTRTAPQQRVWAGHWLGRSTHHHRLVEVFKDSGVPSVTFVEPDDFYRLRLALEQPGRGVVIEGPSGVGKTTALQTALAQLAQFDQLAHEPGGSGEPGGGGEPGGSFVVLRCRDSADVARIRRLREWHRGPVAIDDFHRLDPELRRELADDVLSLPGIHQPSNARPSLTAQGTPQ